MLLAAAISNNVALYDSVLGAHGIRGERSAACWHTREIVPPYYSNLVTLAPGETVDLQDRITSLDLLLPWALKDSFACLDLGPPGWRLLFDAQWYGSKGGDLGMPETDAVFHRVEDAAALAAFEEAWQRTSPAPGVRVFPDRVLDDESLEIYAASGQRGAILNRSSGAVGISNVFPSDPALHRDVARLATRLHPARAIVGYGAHEDLLPLGFAALGPLRVWIRE